MSSYSVPVSQQQNGGIAWVNKHKETVSTIPEYVFSGVLFTMIRIEAAVRWRISS